MPTRDELASVLREATHERDMIPMSPDLERHSGYSREDYADEFGSYAEAIQCIKPNAESHEVEVGIPASRWRYRCPEGHSTWRPETNQFYCTGCYEDPDIHGTMHGHLIDKRNSEAIPFDQFVFRSPVFETL